MRNCLLGRDRLGVMLETASLCFAFNPNPSPKRVGCGQTGLELLGSAISNTLDFCPSKDKNVGKRFKNHICRHKLGTREGEGVK